MPLDCTWPTLKHPGADDALTVLVVNDNASSRDALQRMLRALGWFVQCVPDVSEALQWLEDGDTVTHWPQVALLDADLPDMSSLRMRLQAGQRDGTPTTCLWLASGTHPVPREWAEDGAELVKPLTVDMVVEAIARLQNAPGATAPALSAPVARQRLAGLHLLLVEDNEINQDVAVDILQREGARVTVAANGQVCVDILTNTEAFFDLVLMDLQMPVMDGLQATRLVRQMPVGDDMPIIAMTANALPADREVCMDAGMNDHIGKPFDVESLVTIILRHTRPLVADAATRTDDSVKPNWSASNSNGLSDECLDASTALQRLGNATELYARLLKQLVRSLGEDGDELLSALGQNRALDAARLAHKLKGSTAVAGAMALSRYCDTLQRQLQAEQAIAPGESQVFCDLRDATLNAIQAWLDGKPLPGTRLAPPALSKIQALLAAVEQQDMASFELFEELRPSSDEGPWSETWQTLETAMEQFDVEAAADALRQLIREIEVTEGLLPDFQAKSTEGTMVKTTQ
jgi:CheY-like chemotaxis protein